MNSTPAYIVHEYRPFEDDKQIHGVTLDETFVWFSRDSELVAFDPSAERVVRRLPVPGASAGTAWDGEHLHQVAGSEILVVSPDDGLIVRRMPAPDATQTSGLGWADGHLWAGQFRDAKIFEIDAKTCAIVKTLETGRSVTGVSFVDGELWHGASYDGKPSELRRLREDGTLQEVLAVPAAISGVERTKSGDFWCGDKGRLRLVRRRM